MKKNNNGNKIKINDEVKDFAFLTVKKFRKRDGNDYMGKKEAGKLMNYYLIDNLGYAVDFVLRYGHFKDNEDVQEVKNGIFKRLANTEEKPVFTKALVKDIKDGNDPKGVDLLPILLKEILIGIKQENDKILAEDPNAAIFQTEDLVDLIKLILKKKIKKAEKAGIDPTVAFDALTVIPSDRALKSSVQYRLYSLFNVLYEHAKTKNVEFEKLVKLLIPKEQYVVLVVFSLLERKEKFGNLDDAQKKFYLDVTNWTFKVMEEMNKEDLAEVLKLYVNCRKRDESQGKDGNRRYALSSLFESDYPKIRKAVDRVIAADNNTKKYF